ADARCRERLDRTSGHRVYANALAAEINRQIPDTGLKASLRNAHDVVVRHHLFGSVIGQRQKRTTIRHQLLGALRHSRERIDGNVHRTPEVTAWRVDIAAVELFLVREGDGMHERVDLAPLLLEILEDSVDALFD